VDKETSALLIAKNGLEAAEALLTIKATKLAKALDASKVGVNSYLGF
jgi:hypothetical protein